MNFLKRILAVLLFNILAALIVEPVQSQTLDSRFVFKVRELHPFVHDYQQIYRDIDGTLRVQFGLELVAADADVQGRPLSAVKYPLGFLVFLDYPEYLEGCSEVVSQQFEYAPDLPHYLLMITLKGPECRNKTLLHHTMHLRFRFQAEFGKDKPVLPVALEVLK